MYILFMMTHSKKPLPGTDLTLVWIKILSVKLWLVTFFHVLLMQYNFPKQETVVQFVVDAIQAEAFNTRTLFLIGTYNIGLFP
jgi:hypothetical protein